MLDTNFLIYLSKNRPHLVAERINDLSDDDTIAMSFITWAELLRGAEGSQRREATLQQLEALTRLVPVLYPQGPGICENYAVQATALKRRQQPLDRLSRPGHRRHRGKPQRQRVQPSRWAAAGGLGRLTLPLQPPPLEALPPSAARPRGSHTRQSPGTETAASPRRAPG
jgi:predicted nucleic acid-binding protein